MENLTQFLSEEWLTLLSFFLSTILAILLFIFAIKRKKLTIYADTSQVYVSDIGEKNNLLKITFNGQTVDKMYQTKLYFWNSGNQTIDGNDIVEDLVVEAGEDNKILDISINSTSRNACSISVIPIEIQTTPTLFSSLPTEVKKYKITWDYLDKKDGVSIDVLHTDELNISNPIIKGAKIIKCKTASLYEQHSKKIKTVVNVANALLTLSILSIDIFMFFSLSEIFKDTTANLIAFFVLFAFMLLITVLYFKVYIVNQYFNRIPKTIIKEKTNV